MNAVVFAAILGLAATGEALKCYTCGKAEVAEVAGIDLGSVGSTLSKLTGMPSCDDFDPSSPDKKFEKECSSLEKACIRVVDSKDGKNQLRRCSAKVKDDGCHENNMCFCSSDLCNGSERGWPSAVLLLSAVIAALLGGR
ncbi:hypothetical protein FJT64_007017 [Amphibalanus amphitrite]|uniref:Protein sleepless n=1 Tax=Amphibalanus amphitrite TaxID=1232801 RepID=A0A6A4VVN3_AMPAM|nr:hypothetical protein FJT64_007017 [Amphibalanus amphitrite]